MSGEPVTRLHESLRELFYGNSRSAQKFQLGILALDIAAITFFIFTSFLPHEAWLYNIEIALGVVFAIEYVARLTASHTWYKRIWRPLYLADLIVILSLLMPMLVENYAFLRVMRALRLLRAYRAARQLRQNYAFFARNEAVLFAILHLVVFIFITTAFVYVTQAENNPAIENYTDALYFTVATLTTTGFGDITLMGPQGKIISVLVMIFGISLFIRLAQSIFRPSKVIHTCPQCGLKRHDPDASHCKHCGTVVNIPNEGY